MIDNFSEQCFTDSCLGGGVDIGTGQCHLPSSGFRFSDQYKELSASAMPDHIVFRYGNELNRHDFKSSTEEKGPDSKAVSQSSEDVTRFYTRIDSIC